MDQTTHEVRLANWKTIIEQCQERPKGQTARQWLAENNIPEKQYYYWLRRVRKSAFVENETTLPSVADKNPSSITLVELPATDIIPDEAMAAVTIKTRKSTIEISTAVSDELMIQLVKAVAHAL